MRDSALPVLNLAAALERVGGDEELLKEVTGLYRKESAMLVAEIEAAVRSGSAEDLQQSAHTLKGSLSAVGAEASADAALQLESQGRTKDLRESSQALLDLHRALEQLHLQLDAAGI